MPSTQTQSDSPFGDAAYSPSKSNPYEAPKLPEIMPPVQRPPEQLQQPAAPKVAGKGSGLATAAFGIDSILKGFMRGREQAQQVNFQKAKRLSDGLRYAYETAAQHYVELVRTGGDPAEIQKADGAQRAAYQSWYEMMKKYSGMDGDGKKPKKSKDGQPGASSSSDQQDPAQMVLSKDPKVKAQGIIMMQQKLLQQVGTPANVAARQYSTPEYQNQLKLYRDTQRIEGDVKQKRITLHDLQNKDPKALTDDERSKLERLQSDPELFPEVSRTVPHYGTTDIPGASLATAKDPSGMPLRDKFGNAIDPKMNYRVETVGGVQSYVPSVAKATTAKAGSEQEFIERVAKESGIPESELSSESLLKLRQSWAASNQPGKIAGQNYVYTDKETGQIIVVPLTRVTSGGSTAVPKVSAGGGSGASAGAPTTTPSTATPATPKAKPKSSVNDLPAPGTGAGASSTASTTPPAGSPHGAHVIGHTASQAETKSQAVVADTYKKMKPLLGLLAAQEDYMKEVKADASKATPRQDLSLVVAAVRAMNPGSVRLPQKELELEMKAGSWGDQAARWYEKASTGLLPDDQRADLFKIVQRETTKAGESIAADWQQYMSGQPLPSDLKRFAKSGGGGGSAGTGDSNTPIHPELKNKLDSDFGAPKS